MYSFYLLQHNETKLFHIIAYESVSLYVFTNNFTFSVIAKNRIAKVLITWGELAWLHLFISSCWHVVTFEVLARSRKKWDYYWSAGKHKLSKLAVQECKYNTHIKLANDELPWRSLFRCVFGTLKMYFIYRKY